MPVKVEALDRLVINVADVAVTADWYGRILGMEVKVFDPRRRQSAADFATIR
jgi:catechol 2,3-dioxygenase-like lactoylglutathione lyase family enzyme